MTMNQGDYKKKLEKGFADRGGGVSDAVKNVKSFFSTKDSDKHIVSALNDRKQKAMRQGGK
jgi:hypothetical protein